MTHYKSMVLAVSQVALRKLYCPVQVSGDGGPDQCETSGAVRNAHILDVF